MFLPPELCLGKLGRWGFDSAIAIHPYSASPARTRHNPCCWGVSGQVDQLLEHSTLQGMGQKVTVSSPDQLEFVVSEHSQTSVCYRTQCGTLLSPSKSVSTHSWPRCMGNILLVCDPKGAQQLLSHLSEHSLFQRLIRWGGNSIFGVSCKWSCGRATISYFLLNIWTLVSFWEVQFFLPGRYGLDLWRVFTDKLWTRRWR